MADLPEVRDGDLAQAWNVQQIADLLHGLLGINVRLTRWSHPTLATLRLANRTPGGPILEIMGDDNITTVVKITTDGFSNTRVSGYLDWKYQPPGTPLGPGVGTQTLRMYARAGQLYFKAEGGSETQIPIGPPPGPTMRYAFFIGG